MSINKKVVVIEGDGSVLMNLGTLATIRVNQPKNYILIIVDNEAYGSTGFQLTFTSKGINLDQIAKACNIHKTILITKESDIKEAIETILKADDGPYCVVIKTEKGVPDDISIIPCDALTIRDRFIRSIKNEDAY
jgi:sulfopyruvate decarboxylase subunit beta